MKTLKLYHILLSFAFLLVITNCNEREWNNPIDANTNSTVTTSPASEITSNSAILGGDITSKGGLAVIDRGVCYSTKQNPTTASNTINMGSGTGSFSETVSGLFSNTTYYVRAYATNGSGTEYGNVVSFTTTSGGGTGGTGTITDSRDGHVYKTVKIGTQWWLAENLAYLPSVSPSSGGSDTTQYYYVYEYQGSSVNEAKATANYSTYGVLYNWPAAMNGGASSTANPSGVQGVCPAGWHLPSDDEWTQLTDYLGDSIAGGKLKETGIAHWTSPNQGATNETGFTALPGGYRYSDVTFDYIGNFGYWWSSSRDYYAFNESAMYRVMDYTNINVYKNGKVKRYGFSVRCVRDN